MSLYRSEIQRFVLWGRYGLYTRPEFRADRVTYLVCTPPACVGTVKAIFWHPDAHLDQGERSQLDVDILRIHVLNPIQTMRMRVNELAEIPQETESCEIEQRSTSLTLLKDPKFMIEFQYVSPQSAQMVKKSAEIFKRRLAHGQHFRAPCLGRRRYTGAVREVTADDIPQNLQMHLGRMPWGMEYLDKVSPPRQVLHTFDAEVNNGTIEVPSFWDMLMQRDGAA